MTETETLAAEITRAIRAVVGAVPPERCLWNVERIADYFAISPSTVYSKILCRPDFPTPVQIDGCHARWVAGEVQEWAEQQRKPVRRGRISA